MAFWKNKSLLSLVVPKECLESRHCKWGEIILLVVLEVGDSDWQQARKKKGSISSCDVYIYGIHFFKYGDNQQHVKKKEGGKFYGKQTSQELSIDCESLKIDPHAPNPYLNDMIM